MAGPPTTAGGRSRADGARQPVGLKRQLKGGGVTVVVALGVGVWLGDWVRVKVEEVDCVGVAVAVYVVVGVKVVEVLCVGDTVLV